MDKSLRRHHEFRCKNNRKYYHGMTDQTISDLSRYKNSTPSKYIGINARTPKSCSCAMCGNPRKYFNSLTMQELKSNITRIEYYEQLEGLDFNWNCDDLSEIDKYSD